MSGSVFFAQSNTNTAPPAAGTQSASNAAQDQGPKGRHHGEGFKHDEQQNAQLLSLLKIDSVKLKEQLKAGKSLADLAADAGIDKQQVIDLLVSQETTETDDAMKAGKITQAQADQKKANLVDHITKEVDQKGFAGRGEFGREGREGKGNLNEAASILGMTQQDLLMQLKAGKTLSQIGQDKGVSEDQLVNSLLDKEKKARIQKQVTTVWKDKQANDPKAADGETVDGAQ